MFFVFCFSIFLSTLGGLLRAFVVSRMWMWLAVPILHTTRTFSTGEVFALMCVIAAVKGMGSVKDDDDDDAEKLMKAAFYQAWMSAAFSLLCLVEAWIVKGLLF